MPAYMPRQRLRSIPNRFKLTPSALAEARHESIFARLSRQLRCVTEIWVPVKLTLLARMAISQLKPAVPKHLAHQRALDLAGDLLANLGSELQLGIAISG